jgi:uncharacterized protein (TIGR03437 family)
MTRLIVGLGLATMLITTPSSPAQQSLFGTNLIVNGGADAGPPGASLTSIAATVPGWTRTGNANVLAYDLPGALQSNGVIPPDHSFQYFIAGSTNSTLSQDIDVSAAASTISGGNVKFIASAYVGGIAPCNTPGPGQVAMAFKNANGQTFSTISLGPLGFSTQSLLSLQRQIGLVPPGTVKVTVTITLTINEYLGCASGYAAADSLSLVFNTLGTDPASVLGPNLISNPGGEIGPGVPSPTVAPYIPGWSTSYGASVSTYGGTGWIGLTDPGPPDRGVNVFHGGEPGADMYQDLDVSAAAASIDANKVTYLVSAWFGGVSGVPTPTLTYLFFDWSGKQLAATAQLGPVTHFGTSLVVTSNSAALPPGTRRIHIDVAFPSGNALADNISFTLSPAGAPVITPGGVVPVYSSSTTIEPGSWVSIYGTNLASTTTLWNGDFPISLGGTNVTINSKPAYLWLVSPGQINMQAPDDTAVGTVNVVVTTSNGTATSTVTLGSFGPSFSLYNAKYAAAIVGLPVGSPGNSGLGYDYIGPSGGLPFPSRSVKAGETVTLYGVGFGPTTHDVPAGQAFSGAAACITNPVVTIGGVSAQVTFAGIVEAGLYQLNVVVPNAGSGDRLLQATVGGLTTPTNVYLTLQ